MLEAINQAGTSTYTIKAVAMKAGIDESDVAIFTYLVTVTSPDGSATRTYTLVVTRA